MKTNFSLLFYVKKQRNYTSGDAPIYLRITVDGKRSEITTNRECNPEKWNSKSGRLIGTKQEIKSFNSFLDNLQAKVYEAHRYLSENEKLITSETLKGRILGKVEKARMLINVFRDHNNKMATLVGKDFADGTLERYKTSLSLTQEFLHSRYNISDIAKRQSLGFLNFRRKNYFLNFFSTFFRELPSAFTATSTSFFDTFNLSFS